MYKELTDNNKKIQLQFNNNKNTIIFKYIATTSVSEFIHKSYVTIYRRFTT